MSACEKKCAPAGHPLMGCMWLADIKFDGEGHVPLLKLEAKGGTRYAMSHCCCDYPQLSPQLVKQRRELWDGRRKAFREEWAKQIGRWPSNADGTPWEGHHAHDILHGGSPTQGNNILPTPESIHDEFDEQYPLCYAGQGGWKLIGPDHPYSD